MPAEPQLPAWGGVVFLGALILCAYGWIRAIWAGAQGLQVLPLRSRRPVPWGLDGGVLAALFLLGALASLAAEAAPGQDLIDEQAPGLDVFVVVTQFTTLTAFAVIGVGAIAIRYQSWPLTPDHFGLRRLGSRLFSDVALGFLAAAAMLPFVYGVNLILVLIYGNPTPHPAIESLLSDPDLEVIAAAAVLAAVIAPLFEELAFRVLLQGGLERLGGRHAWWPILVSALAFALAHTNQGFAQLPIGVLAIGIGYVYRQTHSYPAVVGMHMAFNGLSLAFAVAAGQAGVEF